MGKRAVLLLAEEQVEGAGLWKACRAQGMGGTGAALVGLWGCAAWRENRGLRGISGKRVCGRGTGNGERDM